MARRDTPRPPPCPQRSHCSSWLPVLFHCVWLSVPSPSILLGKVSKWGCGGTFLGATASGHPRGVLRSSELRSRASARQRAK
eukprot:5137008-Pyramimonas_sp.AAC.1